MPAAAALFYPRALVRAQLLQLVAGILDDPSLDVVQFDDGGGAAERELAIPFLAGMDEVVVEEALLRLKAEPLELELGSSAYAVTNGSGSEAGVIVSLARPGRLTRIVIDNPTFAPSVTGGQRFTYDKGGIQTRADGDAQEMRLVVRTAEPKQGGGFSFGPPIFADHPFTLASPFYAPVLGGLTVTAVSGAKLQLAFPATSGSGWLIQFASGDEATKLSPLAFTAAVRTVHVAAAPTNLTLVVPGDAGAPDTVLWSYANAFLPDVGAQDVSFTPVAQKRLAAALAVAADVTLPLPLHFASDTGGKLAIQSKTLTAHYVVYPLGRDPLKRRLGGAWTPLRLAAPAARRPMRGDLQLTARHLGRVLNDGSPLPPTALPAAGVRVDAGSWAAAAAPFEAAASAAPGTQLPLVSVQVPLEAAADAEASLEVRGAAAGAPGAPLAPPIVRQLAVGTRGWIEFELAQPLTLATGGEPYWVSLRTTKGELRWFAAGTGAARISADGGETWGDVDPTLLDAAAPLVLLFHAVPPPLPPPQLELQLGATPLGSLTLAGPPTEFSLAGDGVPGPLLDALGRTVGTGRATTEVLVFSRAVCDLTIESLTLSYDPAAG